LGADLILGTKINTVLRVRNWLSPDGTARQRGTPQSPTTNDEPWTVCFGTMR
jgi:hypothetical protein